MRRLTLLAALAALAACTPHQVQVWRQWHRTDPADAEAFVENGCAGMCEPSRSTADSKGWTDVALEPDAVPDLDPAGWGQCSEWMNDAIAAGWTEDQWGTLNWIMARESGCDPGAYNPSGASGLLQIMPMWVDDCGGGSLFDPWFNLACGLHVYHQQGWGAWSVY